jgi:thiamine transport system ATP-binding protein
VRDVTVSFGGRRVLDRIHLDVDAGEIVALLGPSGAGKSTLLRVIAGLLTPDAGTVVVGDDDVTRWPTHRRGVGLMFQDEQLFPHRDVAGNVRFGLQVQHLDRPTIDARVDELLDLVDLRGFGARRVTDLSGGEAKRVALARALAPRPRVLLLDEPLTGLDATLHARLVADLREILHAAGTTAVHVTHDRAEAAAVSDRVLELGRLSGR